MSDTPWPNFYCNELMCHCGECGAESSKKISPDLMNVIQELRNRCMFPLPINSAYRCPKHPIESRKKKLGAHTQGLAVDIRVNGYKAWKVLMLAMQMGCFTGVGINQKGSRNARFIHLDISQDDIIRPTVWNY